MISISEALKIINCEIPALETETIGLYDSIGRILAEMIKADMDLPPFDRSQMDGYAVRVKDLKEASEENPVKLKIIGESVAGKGFDGKLEKGEAVRIMTGARIPHGANSVQKKEVTKETDDVFVEIYEATEKNQNIVARAAEIEKGEKVFTKGECINERMIAALASFGYGKIEVYRQPKVSIIATGSEIVHFSETPRKDQIRDSNSVSLKAFAENCGVLTSVSPLVSDDLETLKKTIEKAAQRSNIVILSGGVSAGVLDLVPGVLAEFGVREVFHKVSVKPGKPIWFGLYEHEGRAKPVFGLPGNPVSGLVCFELFVKPALRKIEGFVDSVPRTSQAKLAKRFVHQGDRPTYWPGVREAAENAVAGDALPSVMPLEWRGSGDLRGIVPADCLIAFPSGDREHAAGDVVEILPL